MIWASSPENEGAEGPFIVCVLWSLFYLIQRIPAANPLYNLMFPKVWSFFVFKLRDNFPNGFKPGQNGVFASALRPLVKKTFLIGKNSLLQGNLIWYDGYWERT